MAMTSETVEKGRVMRCSMCTGDRRITRIASRGRRIRACCLGCRCQRAFKAWLDGTDEHWDLWQEYRANGTFIDARKVEHEYAGRLGFVTRLERGIYPHEMYYGDALTMAAAMMPYG